MTAKTKWAVGGGIAAVLAVAAFMFYRKAQQYLDSDVLVEVADTAPDWLKTLYTGPLYRNNLRTLVNQAKTLSDKKGTATLNPNKAQRYVKITLVKKQT
jgi:hypothetical protein